MSETPGETHLPTPGSFRSVGAWFRYLKGEGFSVPVQAPWAIQRVQKALKVDSQAAFEWLVEKRLLVIEPGSVAVDLRATTEDIESLENGARTSGGQPGPDA